MTEPIRFSGDGSSIPVAATREEQAPMPLLRHDKAQVHFGVPQGELLPFVAR
jgi:hypothetical protein